MLRSLLFTMLMIFMVGCGSNNSDAPASDSNSSGGGGSGGGGNIEKTGTIASLSIENGDTIRVGVNAADQSIRLRALDKDGFLVEQGAVFVQYDKNATTYGTITPGNVTVSNGLAAFVYTPPANIQDLLDQNITSTKFRFYAADSNGTIDSKVYTDLTINFTPTSTSPSQSVLTKIRLLKSAYAVSQSQEKITIAVYAFDQNNNAMPNANLTLIKDGSKFLGSIPTNVKIVDGEGNFTYTAPVNFPIDPNAVDTILITNGTLDVSASATVSFGPHTLTPTLTVDSGDFNLTKDAEQKTVTIIAKDSNGVPLTKGHIDVVLPNGSNIGTFAESQVAINTNGVAIFHYTGPDPLVEQTAKTFMFKFDENQSVSTSLTVGYTPLAATTAVPKTILVYESNQIVNDVNITKNAEKRTFEVQVWGDNDQPFDGGNVRVSFPISVIQNGTDVGYFTNYIVPCVKGKATFEYNAPANINNRNDSFTFGFYHDDANSIAPTKSITVNVKPAAPQPIVTSYTMVILPADDNGTLNLQTKKNFSIKVVDSNGNEIGATDGNYTITNLNPGIADLIDSSNTRTDSIVVNNTKRAEFQLESGKISGAVPIKIHVDFVDVNGNIQTLEKVINQVILSGPPSVISLSYAGTEQDSTHAKFIEKIVVTATDKYFNRVNVQPAVSASLIAGYAKSGTTRLYFAPTGTSTASLDATNNTVTVSGGIDIKNNVDIYNDILATFGMGYTFESSGKWDFNTSYASTSTSVLGLSDTVAKTVSGLGYAIGHNYREDTCDTGNQWTGFISYGNNQTTLDANGMAIININYDYYLTGKDVVLAVNITGHDSQNTKVVRIGKASKMTLRGQGLEAATVTIGPGYNSDTDGNITIPVKISNTAEWLKNANFDVKPKPSDTIQIREWRVVGNVGTCLNGGAGAGVAYVELNVTNTDTTVSGTVTLDNLAIKNEF